MILRTLSVNQYFLETGKIILKRIHLIMYYYYTVRNTLILIDNLHFIGCVR